MKLISYIFAVHVVSEAAVVIEGPKVRTHTEGSTITLTCHSNEQGEFRWNDANESLLIFYGRNKETKKKKYANFDVSVAPNHSNMSINKASLEDEGAFSCELYDDEVFVHVIIEAIPDLRLFVNHRFVPSEEGNGIQGLPINCIAGGAKPNVSVQFKIEDHDWQPPSRYEVNYHDMMYDTVAVLYYDMPGGTTNMKVECRTQGQISVPAVKTSYELSAPACTLQIHESLAKCQCKAIPGVYHYKINIGNEEIEANETLLLNYPSSNVTCFGTNVIGIGTSNTVVFENKVGNSPKLVVIVITICIVIIMILTIILIYRRRNTRGKTQFGDPEGEASGSPLMEKRSLHRVAEDQSKHETSGLGVNIWDMRIFGANDQGKQMKKGKNTQTKGIRKRDKEICLQNEFEALLETYSKSIKCEWEIFAVKILGLPVDKVRATADKKGDDEDPVQEVISSIPNKDLTFMKKLFYRVIPQNKDLCKEFGLKIEKDIDRYHFRGTRGYSNKEATLGLVGPDKRLIGTLNGYSKSMGPIGIRILKEQYAKTISHKTTTILTQDVRNLAKALDQEYLFRASKVVEEYADLMECEMNLMTKLGNDWEIFATEVMKLPEDRIDSIVKKKSTRDQTQNLLNIWKSLLEEDVTATMVKDLTKEIEELNRNVFNGSGIPEDYIYNRNLTSKEQQLQVTRSEIMEFLGNVDYVCARKDGLSEEDFSSMLQKIASVVGKTGAMKVLLEYKIGKSYKPVDNPGYMMIKVLLNKNELKNDKRSLVHFRETLHKSHLYRATAVVDTAFPIRDDENQGVMEETKVKDAMKRPTYVSLYQ